MSTPVGAIGSGQGGGVELTLYNLAQTLRARHYSLSIIAPRGSTLPNLPIIEISGEPQISAQTQTRQAPITLPNNAVLANMWQHAHRIQSNYDLIINLAYDWLPFYLTPFFQIPVAHLVSMGSTNQPIDTILQSIITQYPHSIGMHTQAQAQTYPFSRDCTIIGNGIDLTQYEYCDHPDNSLSWIGRISPEKGLEDAIAAAQGAALPLKVLGHLQDPSYLSHLQTQFPNTFEYLGFLPTAALQQTIRRSRGLLVTPRWIEAFGNVVIEALACGVPVIAYHRGGPAEIVQDGKTGWLVEPDNIQSLIDAIHRLDQIERRQCRQHIEQTYALDIWGDRLEAWLKPLMQPRPQP